MERVDKAKYRIRLENGGGMFEVRAGLSLLAAMEQAGAALIPVGCRGGGCGRCRVRVLAGHYDSKRMSRAHICARDESFGRVLACRIFPREDLLIRVETPPVPPEQDPPE